MERLSLGLCLSGGQQIQLRVTIQEVEQRLNSIPAAANDGGELRTQLGNEPYAIYLDITDAIPTYPPGYFVISQDGFEN